MKTPSTKKDIKNLGATLQCLWIFVVSAGRYIKNGKLNDKNIDEASLIVRDVIEQTLEEIIDE